MKPLEKMLWWVANEAGRKSHTQPVPSYQYRESCIEVTEIQDVFRSTPEQNARQKKKHFPLEKQKKKCFFLLKHFELLLLICKWLNKAFKPTVLHIKDLFF